MTEEVHMATQNNQQTTDRNDPAIDPDTPDNGMGHDKAPAQSQDGVQGQSGSQSQGDSQSQGGSQSQGNNGAQSQENNGNQSGENSFTPDFEPEEHTSPDKTKEEGQTGETDRDIDTPGG
jgi:hypothetical protein